LEKIAEAHRQRTVLEAQAQAEALRLQVISRIEFLEQNVIKKSKFQLMQGEAESFSIEVKAKAEAEQMKLKAAAYQQYNEAAMMDMLMQSLPKVS
jgi:flotillin